MQVSSGNEKSFSKWAKAAVFTKYGHFYQMKTRVWVTGNQTIFRPYFSDASIIGEQENI